MTALSEWLLSGRRRGRSTPRTLDILAAEFSDRPDIEQRILIRAGIQKELASAERSHNLRVTENGAVGGAQQRWVALLEDNEWVRDDYLLLDGPQHRAYARSVEEGLASWQAKADRVRYDLGLRDKYGDEVSVREMWDAEGVHYELVERSGTDG